MGWGGGVVSRARHDGRGCNDEAGIIGTQSDECLSRVG